MTGRCLILGGGIAGLASAIAFRRAGWDVVVHERSWDMRPLGAALSIWPNGSAALDVLGILDAVVAHGAPIEAMLVADQAGRSIIGPYRVGQGAMTVTRSDLQRALMDGLRDVPLRLGDAAVEVQVEPGGAAVRFADGRSVAADLVIDAGGIRSPIARSIAAASPRFSGYGGVVALSDPVDGPALNGLAAEYWGWGERFGIFELPDQRRYWFYIQDQREGQDAPDHGYISGRIAGWPSSVADAVMATSPDRLIPFAIYAKPIPGALGRGRIIGVGDAAHAMQPNLGQGACQALEDAAALLSIARRVAPGQMLAAFEAVRLKRVGSVVRRAAEGKHGAHGSWFVQMATRAALRGVPRSIAERVARATHKMPRYADVIAHL